MKTIQVDSERVKEILGLSSSMVGVKFILMQADIPSGVEKLIGHRYCQALMKAIPNSRGKNALQFLNIKKQKK